MQIIVWLNVLCVVCHVEFILEFYVNKIFISVIKKCHSELGSESHG